MKKIKIGFSGFWEGFDQKDNLFLNILKERYEVEISETPDYLIVSVFGHPFSYLNQDCVRILYTGEPLAPDFNTFDYAIGFDHIQFSDASDENRYYRYPLCFFFKDEVKQHSNGLSYYQAIEALQRKKYFCNFIYGHRSAYGEREAIFEILQKYKRVESAGRFMNNMPGGNVVPFTEEKLKFLRLCKFTIACESICYPGFVTEKIVDPICSDSVPIYYGDPMIEREFNPEAIINLSRFTSWEEGLERVIEIDRDDEQYLKMLMAPKLVSEDYLDNLYNGLRTFLYRIFDQEKEAAYRRLRFYAQKHHEDCLKEYSQFYGGPEYHMFKLRQRLKKRLFRVLERFR